VRDSAHYNWTKTKSTYARLAQELGFGSGNWFWLSTIAQFSVAGKKRSNVVHLQREKSVMNTI
jgi:hypothetical protein